MKTGKKIYLSQIEDEVPTDKVIVFWDTCALLDILRIPIRGELGMNALENYEKIAEYIENDQVVSVTSGLVIREFHDHYDEERQKMLRDQNNLKNKVTDYAGYMINERKRNRITESIRLLNVISRLESILSRILKHTLVLREEKIYRSFADYRLRNKMAPAARKSEYKDCYIWGTFLKFVHKIEPDSPYISFMTKNSKDYEVQSNTLFPLIITDCYKPTMHVDLQIGRLRGELVRVIEGGY